MSFSLTPLLMHSDSVPPGVRAALRAAHRADAADRAQHLEAAARLLVRETGLDCRDVRELVGLPGNSCL